MMLALAVLLLAAASEREQETPTFAVGTERVTVDVVVVDADGRPVTGLGRDDFVVKEDGAVQEILQFEAVDVAAVAANDETEPAAEPSIATNAPASAAGRHFLIVFDDVNVAVANTERVRSAVRSFLERQLREGDEVTLVSTAGGGFWAGRVPEGNEDLLAFLATLRGRRMSNNARDRISDAEAMRIHIDRDQEAIGHVVLRFASYALLGPGMGIDAEDRQGALASARQGAVGHVEALAADVYAKSRERLRQMLTALESAVATLGGRRGRRAVLLASDGFIHDRKLDELQRVREVARRANAALYFLDARGVNAPEVTPLDIPIPPDLENKFNYTRLAMEFAAEESAGAEALAADTGGFTIRGNDLSPGLGRLSLESRSFYLLGYEPAKRRDGRFRKIEVQVRRPGVVVRARKGYHAGLPEAERQPSTSAAGALQAFQGALEGRDIPLRMAAYVLGDAGDGRAMVVLSAEADPAAIALEEKDGRLVGGIDSVSSLAARDTGEVGSRRRTFQLALRPELRRRLDTAWIQMTHAFELPAGRYQATFVARDRGSARVGAVRLKVDVPDLHALRITTPVLSDTLVPAADPDAPASPAPLARRRFAAGSKLFCRFEVAGRPREAGRVVITYEVRRADGTLVTGTAPTPLEPGPDGALARSFSLTLNRAGGYELQLRARDPLSGEEASASAPFEVDGPVG